MPDPPNAVHPAPRGPARRWPPVLPAQEAPTPAARLPRRAVPPSDGSCVEDFVANCYSVEEYNKTYAHCLQPVEGKAFWPVSDREKPLPPKFVRMPGRPKKERKRQDGEKKKPTRGRLSKKGTVIRCRVCKGVGHNRTSCSRRIGSGAQSGGGSQPNTASQETRGSGAPSAARAHSQAPSVAASHSHRPSAAASSTGTTNKHCSHLTVGSSDGQMGMSSSARVRTTLKNGAQAKFTLEATAPGLPGKHSKATVHITGPSSSMVTVSATGANSRKRSREGGPKAHNDKGTHCSSLLPRGPSSQV